MTTPEAQASPSLLRPAKPVGIVGYGAYVPRYRLPAKEVARVWTGGKGGLPIKEKAVPGLDEDVITMSIEAARNAMKRAQIDPTELRAVWVGSESHPYAVKPTSTLVAEAIGAVPNTQAADWEFACKAGTEALVAAMGLVGSGMGHYAMESPAMPSNTRPARAAAPLCWARRRSRWRSSMPPIRMSPIRPTSGGARTRYILSTGCDLRVNRPTSGTLPRRPRI